MTCPPLPHLASTILTRSFQTGVGPPRPSCSEKGDPTASDLDGLLWLKILGRTWLMPQHLPYRWRAGAPAALGIDGVEFRLHQNSLWLWGGLI